MTGGTSRWRVTYQRTIEYEVINAHNLFDPCQTSLLFPNQARHSRRFVVVDGNVDRLYGESIRAYFHHHGITAKVFTFPSGEENKTLEHYLSIARALDSFPIHRRDEPVIAIGGGVLTDVAAFVASTYRRSVPHIKVPTTLMGYIDAAIGIKNGINFNGNKNRLGSFEPPQRVLLDRSFLKSLPRRHILNGVAEIIKLAIIKDAGLFELLETDGALSVSNGFQDEPGGALLDRAIGGMLEELEPNLYEDELARKVDFGHTFSYGLETHHEAHLLHGEAVLLDILLSCLIARERGLLSPEESTRIFALTFGLGFELDTCLLDPHLLLESLEERTYHRNGLQRVPLPHGIGGCVFANDIQPSEVENAHQNLIHEMVKKNERVY